jgi:hypothetical protein
MAESLEVQSGRTEGSTSGIRAVGNDESRSRSMFRVSAATIRGLTAARRPRSKAASACSARWLDSKKVTVEKCRARDRRTSVRALGNGCPAPNPAVNARVEDSRAEDPESLSFASSEAFPPCRCLSVHHWPHLAGLASAYARENSVAFNWTGNCVTCDRGVAEDSAHDGPDRRVHGQRSTRR